jgi:phage head maturation protease
MATVERPKAGDVEERTVADTLAVDGKKIRGRIPYSVESRAMPGGWREVIEPGALKNAKLDRLLATVNHGGGGSLPIGRYPNTLELEDRADGMHWSVDPPCPAPTCARRLNAAISTRAAGGWSSAKRSGAATSATCSRSRS